MTLFLRYILLSYYQLHCLKLLFSWECHEISGCSTILLVCQHFLILFNQRILFFCCHYLYCVVFSLFIQFFTDLYNLVLSSGSKSFSRFSPSNQFSVFLLTCLVLQRQHCQSMLLLFGKKIIDPNFFSSERFYKH